jgi:zinc protease
VFTGTFRNDQQQRLIVRAVADTLEGSLQRVLREDLGGTYGVSVEPDFTQRPTAEYRLTLSFACDPARTTDLVKALFSVVDQFEPTARATDRCRTCARGCCGISRRTGRATVTG